MSTVHTLTNAGQIVEALPSLFGFRPSESLVVITHSGPRRAVGFRLRLDRPSPDQLTEAAQMIAMHVHNHSQPDDGVTILSITADAAAGRTEVLELVEAIDRSVVVVGTADSGVLTTWPDVEQFDYTDPATSVTTVTAMAAGQQIVGSREQIQAALAPQHNRPPVTDGVVDIDVCKDILTGVLTLNEQNRAMLVRAAGSQSFRDRLWGSVTAETAAEHAAVWTAVAIQCHPTDAGATYATAAMVTWLSGDGVRAQILADHCVAQTDPPKMGALVQQVVDAGMNPKTWFESHS